MAIGTVLILYLTFTLILQATSNLWAMGSAYILYLRFVSNNGILLLNTGQNSRRSTKCHTDIRKQEYSGCCRKRSLEQPF
jgi:hypothetical protein